jgi:hypothetical protein
MGNIMEYLHDKIEELSDIEFKTQYEIFLLEYLWDEYTNFGGK